MNMMIPLVNVNRKIHMQVQGPVKARRDLSGPLKLESQVVVNCLRWVLGT